mgnify:CR=1 FL=1
MLDVRTILWIFWAVIISFTLGMLLLRTDRIWSGTYYWIAGNVTSMFAITTLLWMQTVPFSAKLNVVPDTMVLVASMFKVLSLSGKHQRARSALLGAALIAGYILVARTLDALTAVNLTLGGAGVVAAIIAGWQAYLCYRSPRWRSLNGSGLFAAAAMVICLYYIAAGVRGFNVQDGRYLFQQSGLAQANLIISLAYYIICHICLIAMLAARLSRSMVDSQMRQRRQINLTRQAEQHALEMVAQANEKQALLDVLAHEVRQPFNNAQAALNDVLMTLHSNSPDYAAGQRLQAIIDHIVLSLSNAIVGSSMLERKTQSLMATTDVVAVCELACSDMGLNWRNHVELELGERAIFTEADPILLRLAIRNLLDNALKHSQLGRKVKLHVGVDEALMRVAITVTNWPATEFAPDPALFERGVRGKQAAPENKGLGLFIVSEVAVLHHGEVQNRVDEHGCTEFKLLLPA